MREFIGSVPRREFTDELYAHALAYPWARPASSFLLRGEDAHPLDELDAAERERALSLAGAPGRHALLAFGSNGAPERLALKFKELPDERAGRCSSSPATLHDFDVGAAPMPTFYGALPATIFPSPGAAVRASLLWVSDVAADGARLERAQLLARPAGRRALRARRRARADDRRPARLRLALGRAVRRRARSSRWRPCPPSAAPARR